MPCRVHSKTDTRRSRKAGTKGAIKSAKNPSSARKEAENMVNLTAKEKATVITLELLKSKRFWAGAIMALASVIHLLWGVSVDEASQLVAVDNAVRYGAVAVDIIGALFLAVTKITDGPR